MIRDDDNGYAAFENAEHLPDQEFDRADGNADDGEPFAAVRSLTVAAAPSAQTRLLAVRSARNPLLEAARPLLRVMADMPETLAAAEVAVFHQLLVQEVGSFQSLCNAAQVRHEHMVGASYALCTAIDERAHSTRWGAAAADGAGVWAGQQLAVFFHDDARGGDKVFLLIGRLVAGPDEHIDLLEVLYFILGLGFEGRYGAAANGRRQIETIRHRLYTVLNASRAEVPNALSLQLQGAGSARSKRLGFMPPWLTALIALLMLLFIFGVCKYRLMQVQAGAVQRISAIGAMHPPSAIKTANRALRLKELLGAEIERGTVAVHEDAAQSAVTFRGDEMFVPGQARLNPRILPVLAKVAVEIAQVAGTVRVVGHSDNRPIRTGPFPDNQALSEQRAAAVATVLESKGVERVRLKVEGHAEAEPVADNATAAGRARNRRVDIVVSLDGASASNGAAPTSRTRQGWIE